MTMLKEFAAEIVGMFIGDLPLTLALLGLVALATALIHLAGIDALAVGGVFLLGCLALLVVSVIQASRSDF